MKEVKDVVSNEVLDSTSITAKLNTQENGTIASLYSYQIKHLSQAYKLQVNSFMRQYGSLSDFDLVPSLIKFVEIGSSNTQHIKKFALLKLFRLHYKNNLEALSLINELFKPIKPRTKASASITKDDILSIEQISLLGKIKLTDKQRSLINFLLETGARISEVLNIKISDIKPTNNRSVSKITILGKGNKERTIFINNIFIEKAKLAYSNYDYNDILNRYKKSSSSKKGINPENRQGYLFPINRQGAFKAIKSIGQKIGVNNLSPHKARHSHATIALSNNKPMAMVSKYLGHSTIAITAKTYDHNVFSPDDFENGLIMNLH